MVKERNAEICPYGFRDLPQRCFSMNWVAGAQTESGISRFEKVENLANQKEIDMKNSTLETLDKLWDEAKTCE